MSTDTRFNENTYLHKGAKSIEMVTLKDKQDSSDDDCKTKSFDRFSKAPSQSIDTWKVTKMPSDSTHRDGIQG